MIVNLLQVWKNHNYQDNTGYQNTLVFKTEPKYVFVKDDSLLKITTFDEMDSVQLTEEEKKRAEEVAKKLNSIEGQYDGDLFFLHTLMYNSYSNELYVGLVKAKYSVVSTLSLARKEELGLYRTGVLSPTITSNNEIVFLERSRGNAYSVVSGFLEQNKKKDNKINPISQTLKTDEPESKIGDLINQTAVAENFEELYENSSVNFNSDESWSKNIVGISYTKQRGCIEFIVNIRNKDITTSKFIDIFKNNKARDREEHTQNYFTAQLDDNEKIKKYVLNSNYKGKFLYMPIILSNLKATDNQNIIIKQYENLDNCAKIFTTFTDRQFKTNIPTRILALSNSKTTYDQNIIMGQEYKNLDNCAKTLTAFENEQLKQINI